MEGCRESFGSHTQKGREFDIELFGVWRTLETALGVMPFKGLFINEFDIELHGEPWRQLQEPCPVRACS